MTSLMCIHIHILPSVRKQALAGCCQLQKCMHFASHLFIQKLIWKLYSDNTGLEWTLLFTSSYAIGTRI